MNRRIGADTSATFYRCFVHWMYPASRLRSLSFAEKTVKFACSRIYGQNAIQRGNTSSTDEIGHGFADQAASSRRWQLE